MLYATGDFCIYKVKSEKAYQTNQNTRVLIKEHWAVHILGLHKLIWLIGAPWLIEANAFVLQHLDCWQCFIAILSTKNITNPQLEWFTLCKSQVFKWRYMRGWLKYGIHKDQVLWSCIPASFQFTCSNMLVFEVGVSKKRGIPKWMVFNGKPENPIKMDDLGVTLFSETSICWCLK